MAILQCCQRAKTQLPLCRCGSFNSCRKALYKILQCVLIVVHSSHLLSNPSHRYLVGLRSRLCEDRESSTTPHSSNSAFMSCVLFPQSWNHRVVQNIGKLKHYDFPLLELRGQLKKCNPKATLDDVAQWFCLYSVASLLYNQQSLIIFHEEN